MHLRQLRQLKQKTLLAALLTIVTIAVVTTLAATAAAQSTNYAVSARAKFSAKNYDEAIILYRKHLRRHPDDESAWAQLGASYYHTGLPKRGLRYLKQVERSTVEKSYNYYYQGLCYIALEEPEKAKQYFSYAASRFVDEYASRATYEMAAVEYEAQQKARARYWLNLYKQRYPKGVLQPQVRRIEQSLTAGTWLTDIEGTEKPDVEASLFKYNKLSLTQSPHYWFFQGGGQYITRNGQEPKPGGGIKPKMSEQLAGIANAGVGSGPWREGSMSAFAGYTYRQLWLTDKERIATFIDDPSDIQYFPLRGDLLERRHQFYGDFRRQFMDRFFFGLYGRQEFARIGSSIFPGPDNAELNKVLKISDTQMFIPWIGVSYLDSFRTLFYLYLRKEINEDSPAHSNKSYDFGMDNKDPVISLGISHDMEFPTKNLSMNIELFRYEFVYNDYWLDYTRNGILISAQHEVIPKWFISGLVGYYQDDYILPRLKLQPCGTAASSNDSSSSGIPNTCKRADTGFMYQVGLYWNLSQFQRFAGEVLSVENRNSSQKEFEENSMTFQFSYTLAFPSVRRVSRMVDRFADSAFTKEAE